MFIVITGLDGSGTSTIATKLHNLDKGSILLHTPSTEYECRDGVGMEQPERPMWRIGG